MGNGDDDTATSRLRLLNQHFRQHPVTGPTERSAPTATPTIPLDLATVDHIRSCVTELATDVLTVNPAPTQLPDRIADVYAWCLDNTKAAAPAQRRRRDTIIYRQSLEHAIAMRDFKVVPPHRCPACRTFGLMWRPSLQRALCTNRRCLNDEGTSNTWDLARLAYEHVAARESFRQVSAT